MIILLAVAIVSSFPFTLLTQQYAKLDSDSKHLALTISVASLGGSLFALRNTKRITPKLLEGIETTELLLLIVIPCVEISVFLMKTDSTITWSMTPLILGSMGWYLLVLVRHKVFDNYKEEKIFNISITYVLFFLIALGSFLYWVIISWSPLSRLGS